MTKVRPIHGAWCHFLLTLRLNLRSRQALVYGYAVPVLFLLGFGGVFRGETPLLANEMGQLLTITILGGACFGMPTALVAERERGVWRRYRLLPVTMPVLMAGTLAARLAIIGSAVALQLVLARLLFGTPPPAQPVFASIAFLAVTAAFLGLGLLIAALADDVPAVQALGQCVFLPMILIGGVGVPLAILPAWAQHAASFMPGRYAVELLQQGYRPSLDPGNLRFAFLALAVIGVAAATLGVRLFRWDSGRHVGHTGLVAVAVALSAWIAVGCTAMATGRSAPLRSSETNYAQLSDVEIGTIRYDDLPGDNELATRLAPPFSHSPSGRVAALAAWLKTWPGAATGEPVEDTRHLLGVAAIADVGADVNEAEIARVVYDELQARYDRGQLTKILAWIILHPDDGTTVTIAPELELRRGAPPEEVIRERSVLYAKKFLGRQVGRITAP
ncbi:MAG TPA: ABC transporter permease [Opitutaceae bacterium]|nr:ABC transporter permease [Opitutaceae bacterium]